jgi:hypothetical protein
MSERHGIEGVFILGSRKRTEEHLTAVIETPGAQGVSIAIFLSIVILITFES